jgi:hypothetical protein
MLGRRDGRTYETLAEVAEEYSATEDTENAEEKL